MEIPVNFHCPSIPSRPRCRSADTAETTGPGPRRPALRGAAAPWMAPADFKAHGTPKNCGFTHGNWWKLEDDLAVYIDLQDLEILTQIMESSLTWKGHCLDVWQIHTNVFFVHQCCSVWHVRSRACSDLDLWQSRMFIQCRSAGITNWWSLMYLKLTWFFELDHRTMYWKLRGPLSQRRARAQCVLSEKNDEPAAKKRKSMGIQPKRAYHSSQTVLNG